MDPLSGFWHHADDDEPARMRSQMGELLSASELSRARALFERASLEDFLGEESAAIPLYEASLSSGLDSVHESKARIQLASSLRNVGRLEDASRVLRDFEFFNEFASARDAFMALILWDLGDGVGALRAALQAAKPALGTYRRAIGTYADKLCTDRPRNNDSDDNVADHDRANSLDDPEVKP
ncbi:tetratricopeptide repeat protein [Rhodococcus sp. 1R11]|uniref:tetratricopeptide repeat protein n=1 Tax=Rhodococcus sp. 1R11 TaxID=2559614 RepID=UPI001071BD6C|nr:tetratricopeptide repeat protein [Rhodococcus sp. 1R11]TFI43112.1 tetratricopeptide repeat protein [Rhodococcus sp. 1R11]